MSDSRIIAGFYPRALMSASLLEDNIFGAAVGTVEDTAGFIIGECVVDGTGTGLVVTDDAAAINERKLTVAGDLPLLTDSGALILHAGSSAVLSQLVEGARTITINDPDWWSDLPYENDSGQTYRVYASRTEFPIDIGVSSGGARGYSRWVRAPGVTVKPASVADTGTELRLLVTTGLTALGIQEWMTANDEDPLWSYDCVVYLDTDQSGVTIAVDDPDVAIAFTAKLTRRAAGGWVVDLAGIGDGYLGQASPSTTAAHYSIVVLGPIITQTNFDANDDYVHIATVLSGVAETIDHTNQLVVESLSQALVDLVDVPEKLLAKGWTTLPSVTFGATTVTIGVGEGFVLGQAITSTATVAGPTGGAGTFYGYYDFNTATWALTTSATTANSTGRLALFVITTDAGGNILSSSVLGRSVSTFNEPHVLTVSSQASDKAMFPRIEDALAWAVFMNAQTTSDLGWVIELVGNVTVTASIASAALVGVPNVMFRARGGRLIGSSASAAINGSKIQWTFDNPLFDVTSGVTLRNWRFEGIVFDYDGTGTAADTAIVANTAGDIRGLEFCECTFDGNDAFGGGGYLPHVVYSNAGSIVGLTVYGCRVNCAEAMLYVTAAADATTQMIVQDCVGVNDSGPLTLSQGGFIVDLGAAGSDQSDWVIRGNRMTSLLGSAIRAYQLKDSRIVDNTFRVDADASVVYLGNSTTNDDVERVVMHDNVFRQNGTTPASVVTIITSDQSGSVRASIIMHDNIIDGVAGPTGSKGVDLSGGATVGNLMFHDNILSNVETGASFPDIDDAIIHHNVVSAEIMGFFVGGVASGNAVLGSNIVSLTGADPIGVDLSTATASESWVMAGNIIDVTAATGNAFCVQSDTGGGVNSSVFGLNVLRSGVYTDDAVFSHEGDGCAFVGNVTTGGLWTMPVAVADLAIVGNVIGGNSSSGAVSLVDVSNTVLGGNVVLVSIDVAVQTANNVVITGNIVNDDLDLGGTELVVTGNYMNGLKTTNFATDVSNFVVVGNLLIGELVDGTANHDFAVVGNIWTGGAQTWDFDEMVIAANLFTSALTLSANGDEGAIGINRLKAGITNNSTNTTTTGNDV